MMGRMARVCFQNETPQKHALAGPASKSKGVNFFENRRQGDVRKQGRVIFFPRKFHWLCGGQGKVRVTRDKKVERKREREQIAHIFQ